MEVQFGDQVLCTAVYKRKTKDRQYSHHRKEWHRDDTAPRSGRFLGWRTLSDGRTTWDDDSMQFEPETHFRAALVCFNARTNPLYVPEDAIVPV